MIQRAWPELVPTQATITGATELHLDPQFDAWFLSPTFGGGGASLIGCVGASPGLARRVLLVNVGSINITLKHESGDATAAEHRIFTSTLADVTIGGGQICYLLNDPYLQRWRPAIH